MRLANGDILNSPEQVHQGVLNYFQDYLTNPSIVEKVDLASLIQCSISAENNLALAIASSKTEILAALKSIPKESSSGPDGFGSGFYLSCWDLIKEDVIEVAKDFFSGSTLPRFYTASYLVLILKVEDPKSFDKFLPISLCSVAYKIFSKEMVHSLNKKTKCGNIIVKIDMAKAYDHVCNLVKECVQSHWFSIMMNGTFKGFFQPLGILDKVIHLGAPLVSHLLYADDLLVFVNGGKRSVLKLMKTLEVYEKWSGQLINKEKSAFFFSNSITLARRRNLMRSTGFVEGKFPVTYLGVPLVSGRLTSRDLKPLIEKIRRKIAGWKLNLLSQGGRLTLMKHVLACITTHLLAVLNVPLKVFKKLNFLLSTFFLGELNGRPRMKWCSWDRICKPYKEGGFGMRNFDEVQRSLQMKIAWRLLIVDNLWTKFFRVKYVKHGHIFMAKTRRNASRFWKSIMNVFPEVTKNVIVKVREGRSSFWFDRWLASGPLCASRDFGHSEIRIKDVWVDGSWDENYLLKLVGLEKTEEIMNGIVAGKVGSDITIWKSEVKGEFTSASAWDLIRVKGTKYLGMDWI
ncbi:uncharacterized protein LOC121238253 [Juglans microcarpa x Juglans regia]|uniref:uncharacterized protein LOC121238253 n=1 Tax=Juglans microcarpa x Juglans regia TaxID=2249226 RepID=UPI001B7E9AA9|nr:uncharacterized protein LOC121238253 [Juglans microcarpa x Juglans regia]